MSRYAAPAHQAAKADAKPRAMVRAPRRLRPQTPFGPVQTFKVGAADSRFEADAERTAHRVVQSLTTATPGTFGPPQISRVTDSEAQTLARQASADVLQRQVEEEEEEEIQTLAREPHADVLQRQISAEAVEEEEEQVQTLQAKDGSAAPGATGAQSAVDTAVSRALASEGREIPLQPRLLMEQGFGADFSDVEVHAGPEASEAARTLGARAFTLGRDIVLGEGESNLESPAGQHLLAHELTHVIQQTGADAPKEIVKAPDGVVQRNGNTFRPVNTLTAEWSAQIWDTQLLDEQLADVTLRYTHGVDATNRSQIWDTRATSNRYANLINLGAHVQTARVGNDMDLTWDFALGGPSVQIGVSRGSTSGSSVGVTAGPVTIGFTSGTTVTQTYTVSGPGTAGTMRRSVRFTAGSGTTLVSQDFPSRFNIYGSGGSIRYSSIEVRRERYTEVARTP